MLLHFMLQYNSQIMLVSQILVVRGIGKFMKSKNKVIEVPYQKHLGISVVASIASLGLMFKFMRDANSILDDVEYQAYFNK